MPKLTSRPADIYNLTLGSVLENPIQIKALFPELEAFELQKMEFDFQISNDANNFSLESELARYHSMENKQKLSYNPRGSACTAHVVVSYDDYDEEKMWNVHRVIDEFTHKFLAFFLGFCQRRRIIIGNLSAVPNSKKNAHLMGFNLATELIDSVGYGPIAILPENLQVALNSASNYYLNCTKGERENLLMLLRRHNDILNLPYTYERFEGYWRIVECLGKNRKISVAQDDEYKRIRNMIGLKESKNLRRFLSSLFLNEIDYSDDEILSSFNYRNESTHNYLASSVIDDPNLPTNFHFLAECADRLIFAAFGIDKQLLIPAKYTISENRIF